jgi:hypothetical protein
LKLRKIVHREIFILGFRGLGSQKWPRSVHGSDSHTEIRGISDYSIHLAERRHISVNLEQRFYSILTTVLLNATIFRHLESV